MLKVGAKGHGMAVKALLAEPGQTWRVISPLTNGNFDSAILINATIAVQIFTGIHSISNYLPELCERAEEGERGEERTERLNQRL